MQESNLTAKNNEFQTRNHNGELNYFDTFGEAVMHAKKDPTVWKISFSLPTNERIRLVFVNDHWEPSYWSKEENHFAELPNGDE